MRIDKLTIAGINVPKHYLCSENTTKELINGAITTLKNNNVRPAISEQRLFVSDKDIKDIFHQVQSNGIAQRTMNIFAEEGAFDGINNKGLVFNFTC